MKDKILEGAPVDAVKTVSREELKEMMDQGEKFYLLEVLSEEKYRREHLPGAIHFTNPDRAPETLPDKNANIVVYCSSFN